jgi:tetratricopeptide (TPR) repeat protein
VDRWVADGADVVSRDSWSIHAVRRAVEEMDHALPARVILHGIVDLVATSRTVDVDLLAPRLLAYGHALDLEGRFALAADVLQAVIAHVDPEVHADVAVDAYMRLGFCLRMLGRLEEATAAYATAGQLAQVMGDTARILRARVADGKLALARGNLPAAASILDETVRAAGVEPALAELRATALHDRAAVAFAALEGATRQAARDRVLADLATMFIQLGVRDAARDALVLLTVDAEEQYTRWMARINLMELAALEGAELPFEQHRRALAGVDLPADLAANYHLHVGLGYRAFGRRAAAVKALECALELATRHDLHQLAFQAERTLVAVRRHHDSGDTSVSGPPRPQPVVIPASLQPVATAIRELRDLSGVG